MFKHNKLIIYILLFVISFSNITIYPNAADDYNRGDLRCPNGKNTKKCTQYDKNNKVTTDISKVAKVVVKETTDNNIIVSKTVEKDETKLGRYIISFSIEGGGQQSFLETPDVAIVVIRDASTSFKEKKRDAAIKAIKGFASDCVKEGYSIGIASFGTKLRDSREVKNEDLSKHSFYEASGRENSNIYFAFDKAKKLLKGKGDDVLKFVVVFGDGRYWRKYDHNGTETSEVGKKWTTIDNSYLQPLKKLSNLTMYAIKYNGKDRDYYVDNSNSTRNYKATGHLCGNPQNKPNAYKRGQCDKIIMQEIAGKQNVIDIGGGSDYSDAFNKIKEQVNSIVGSKKTTVSYSINDKIGNDFLLLDDSLNKKDARTVKIDSKNIDDSFYVEIDKDCDLGWHATNNNYTLTYTINNQKKQFTSTINPEVYWKPDTVEWPSCSSSALIDKEQIIEKEYYTINCKQTGTAILTTNNLKLGSISFNVTKGYGFPVQIELNSSVTCNYEFDVNKFKANYNNLRNELLRASRDNKQQSDDRVIKEIRLREMGNDLTNYINYVKENEDLVKYRNTFSDATAKLNIKYKNSSDIDELTLINGSSIDNNLSCNQETKETILNQTVFTKRTCTLNSKKTLILPMTCLEMKGGNAIECDFEGNDQINGGNKYYVSLDETGGYVSVVLPNITLTGSGITLNGEKKNKNKSQCEFTITNQTDPNDPSGKIIYRQIELSDPFVQGYSDKKRSIGTNWKNSQYNFVNIIKNDIWSSKITPEYQFKMSKTNIHNIVIDTSESSINSYLGSNCEFNSNHKYVCNFVRDTNNSNYFSR